MKQILIIEDDAALRENTAELLELAGYETITAPNGRVGIEKAKSMIPDLIICDIMMPEVDGYGVLQNLADHQDTSQIPFIFLSAKTEHKEIRKGMDLGADDYLTKPFEETELLSAIESRLAKSILLKRMLGGNDATTASAAEPVRNLHELKNYFDDEGEELEFDRGAIIYREGEHSNTVFLVLEGVVKTHQMDESGKELITALYKPDDFLGFTSFTDHIPYHETATAMEGCKVVAVSKKDLRTILEENQQVSLELMELLTDNLSEIKEQLLQMAYGSVRKKTAQTILQFAQLLPQKNEGGIRIARNDLAGVAGIATESLIRTLSGLKKEGLIAIEGRNIRILDMEGLKLVH